MNETLKYKLDLLKLEITTINTAILDKDQNSRHIKEWAITLWLGAVGFVGSKHIVEAPTLNTNLWAASVLVIPISFLILELYNKRSQRKFLWRTRKIYRFINDRDFSELNDIDDFRLYDPAGENWRREPNNEEYQTFENFISLTGIIRVC